MYAFAQRPDTRVVDEPLYGHYLRVSGADHPAAQEVIASMDNDGERVVRERILGHVDRPVLFMKQMAHHLIDVDIGFLKHTVNVLLIRDPIEMLPSLAHIVPRPILRDTAIAMQCALRDQLRTMGQDPPVLDSRELLRDPRAVLMQLCERLGLPFMDAMLAWEAKPRPEDGIWAKHWYHNVHRSTGFQPYRPKPEPFPEELEPLLRECQPYYEVLYRNAIKVDQKGSCENATSDT